MLMKRRGVHSGLVVKVRNLPLNATVPLFFFLKDYTLSSLH